MQTMQQYVETMEQDLATMKAMLAMCLDDSEEMRREQCCMKLFSGLMTPGVYSTDADASKAAEWLNQQRRGLAYQGPSGKSG